MKTSTTLGFHALNEDDIGVRRWASDDGGTSGVTIQIGIHTITFFDNAIAVFDAMVRREAAEMEVPLTREDVDLILHGAPVRFPLDVPPFAAGWDASEPRCMVTSADGNNVATAWVDPVDGMPIYKPSGSTPASELSQLICHDCLRKDECATAGERAIPGCTRFQEIPF